MAINQKPILFKCNIDIYERINWIKKRTDLNRNAFINQAVDMYLDFIDLTKNMEEINDITWNQDKLQRKLQSEMRCLQLRYRHLRK